ncbi:GNAT family N-acetyltransferase [Legionella sp. km772]|uniref:GNAT family N-acetyltransferase n=1 Tax=Legionella sp. km772 TaxID=2498111 RepID=UPI000F8D8A5E|nr:GNAT family protein [Legionella sp. km772]RUR05079.1 N-acetyltransferase [Legionella sp. km772]
MTKATILKGKRFQLEPLDLSHYDGLSRAANHEQIWRYMPDKATGVFFASWFAELVKKMSLGTQISYIVRRISDQEIVGATAYYDYHGDHKRLALGYSWYVPEMWGSGINCEAKFLMLTQAFEQWGINRVELGADPRNTRSVSAIKKLGAIKEGVLREHMVSSDGQLTNTLIFSILAVEWPQVKAQLMQKMGQ